MLARPKSVPSLIWGIFRKEDWVWDDQLILVRGQLVISANIMTQYPNSLCRNRAELRKHICNTEYFAHYKESQFALHRVHFFSFYRFSLAYRRHNKMAMHLYFVTEPDVDGVEGEPLLGSAGKDPEDAWQMLASNREREMGVKQNVQELKDTLTARGCVVHKYLVRPLQA